MMRRFSCLYAREDVVETLLRKNRLLDVPLLNFFNGQVSRELTQTATEATTTSTVAATGSEGETLSESEKKRRELLASKQKTFADFEAVARKVKVGVVERGPTGWLGDVYGESRWSSSYLSALSCSSKGAEGSNGRTVSGKCLAFGGVGSKPTSVQLVVQHAESQRLEVVEVSLTAANLKATDKGSCLEMTLNNTPASLLPQRPVELAASQHYLTSIAYKGILEKLQTVAALHATHHVQYDSLLIGNKIVQKQLAELACFNYGLQCLSDYVLGAAEVEEDEVRAALTSQQQSQPSTTLPEISLLESLILNVYAENALMNGMDHAWSIVRQVSLEEQVRHRSSVDTIPAATESNNNNNNTNTVEGEGEEEAAKKKKEAAEAEAENLKRLTTEKIMIDYPYLKKLFNSPKYLLTSSDGEMESQIVQFVGPFMRYRANPAEAAKDKRNLLKHLEFGEEGNNASSSSSSSSSSSPLSALLNPLKQLVGLRSAGSVRLTAPHMNLSIVASNLENDLVSFLALVEKRIANSTKSSSAAVGSDIPFLLVVGQYVSEVLATVAVIYRATAVLQQDEQGRGHQEWLLAQSFCASSEERRRKLLFELSLQDAAEKVLQTSEDLSNYSTHPVELMNATPAKKKTTTSSSNSKKNEKTASASGSK